MKPRQPLQSAALLLMAAYMLLGHVFSTLAEADGTDLRAVESFAAIGDRAERSQSIFLEAARVLTHPRCVNCHPAGDRPHQGELGEWHEPPVIRGPGGHGFVGMRCRTCHQKENFDAGGVPGAPQWHLAPKSMAWEAASAAEICRQIKNKSRNGQRDIEAIAEHLTRDPLVLWGWNPGAGREPVPGSVASFRSLVEAWVETGAECPSP